MADFIEMLLAEISKDPSFLDLGGTGPVLASRSSKLMPPGTKIKTLKKLRAGDLSLKRGAVGRILGVSKAPSAYVVAFDGSVAYVDPTLVAKASATKDKTTVEFQAKSSANYRVHDSVRVVRDWGYMLSKLDTGDLGTVVSASAGNFGSFDSMLVIKADSGHFYMIPEQYLEVFSGRKAPQLSLSEESYLDLEPHVDSEIPESFDVEGDVGQDLDIPTPPMGEDVSEDQAQMLEVIHKLESIIDVDRFKAWLDNHKGSLTPEAYDFGLQLLQLWGNKLGVVFSYPVSSSCNCVASVKTPYIYHSKLCNGCVSRSGNHCIRHSAGLLTEKQIASTSDFHFLRMISKAPIGYHRIFSSLKDFVKKELFGKVRVSGKSSIELDFDPDA